LVQHTRVNDLHGEPGALAISSSNLDGPTVNSSEWTLNDKASLIQAIQATFIRGTW